MTDSAIKEITYNLNHYNYQYDFFEDEKETVTIHSIEKIGTYFSRSGSNADVDMVFKTNVTSELKGNQKNYIQCFYASYDNLTPENIESNISNFNTNESILNSFSSLPKSQKVD